MIAKVGSDPYGSKYIQHLNDEGINTKYLDVAGESSGIALIVVSSSGQNQIVINANANQYLNIDDAVKAKPILDSAKVNILVLGLKEIVSMFHIVGPCVPVRNTARSYHLCSSTFPWLLNPKRSTSDETFR